MATCPLDGTPLREDALVFTGFDVCPKCAGAWVDGSVTRSLLDGSLTLPEHVLQLGGTIEQRLRTPAVVDSPGASFEAASAAAAPTRRHHRVVRCAQCSTRIRPADGAEVATCIRCGGLWIPGGDPGALVRWYRTAVQLRAIASLKPTRIQYGRWRHIDEHGDFARMLVVLAAAFAFFVVLAPLNGGIARFPLRLRSLALGAGSIALLLQAFRHPSKSQPGALTRKGFALALAGMTLATLAILSWD